MKLNELQNALKEKPYAPLRFKLPGGDYIPAHAHLTEVGHVVRNFIDCGGVTGREEKVVLQTHVGEDTEHRLQVDRFAKILSLGEQIIPIGELPVEVEYDCCVVAQYPITAIQKQGDQLDVILERGRTQCRARERRQTSSVEQYCTETAKCC